MATAHTHARTPGDRLAHATAAAGAFVIAFSAIFVRLADVAPATAAVFRCAYAVPFLGVIALRERRRYGPRTPGNRRIALYAGLLFAADLVLWHYSIGYVGAGLATVLANTQVVLVALAAWWLLGERPTGRLLAAVPVVVVGVVLISGVLGEGAYGENPLLGVVFATLTAVAYAGFILVLRYGNQDRNRPAGPLFDATLSAAIASAVAGLVIGDLDLIPTWPAHGWLFLLATTAQVVAWLLISISLPRLPAAVTSILLMLQPVGAVVFSMLLLGEDPSAVQLAGCGVVLAGVLLGTGRRPTAPAPDAPAPLGAPIDAEATDAHR